jgi:hypothetical protein
MNETEIEEVLRLLKKGIKNSNWDMIIEAEEFLEEFSAEVDEDV